MTEKNILSKYGCSNGWVRYENNPVVGDPGDFCCDPSIVKVGNTFKMFMSWRIDGVIHVACSESKDGFNWSERKVVLSPRPDIDWEQDVNRVNAIYHDGKYKMWYTSQTGPTDETYEQAYVSSELRKRYGDVIGYAESEDGYNWKRLDKPVMVPDSPWEEDVIMCPKVIYDEDQKLFRMWYAGYGWYEAGALGYAESEDGIHWTKFSGNPILTPCQENWFEANRVSGSEVLHIGDWYYLFYISYADIYKATISMARSRNGITNWERHPLNPIIATGLPGDWDCESVYKPSMYYDKANDQWLMYYNARSFGTERIGIAIHKGFDLWNA